MRHATRRLMHWWRHRSDRTKIGDIKKTVAAFSLQHGVYTQLKPPSLNTLKSCKTKTNPKFGGALFSRTSEFSTHQNNLILAFHQFEAHWLSKTISVIPRLFKEDFVLTFFESKAKHRFCFRGCRSILDQTARIWPLCLLSLGRSARWCHQSMSLLGFPYISRFTTPQLEPQSCVLSHTPYCGGGGSNGRKVMAATTCISIL